MKPLNARSRAVLDKVRRQQLSPAHRDRLLRAVEARWDRGDVAEVERLRDPEPFGAHAEQPKRVLNLRTVLKTTAACAVLVAAAWFGANRVQTYLAVDEHSPASTRRDHQSRHSVRGPSPASTTERSRPASVILPQTGGDSRKSSDAPAVDPAPRTVRGPAPTERRAQRLPARLRPPTSESAADACEAGQPGCDAKAAPHQAPRAFTAPEPLTAPEPVTPEPLTAPEPLPRPPASVTTSRPGMHGRSAPPTSRATLEDELALLSAAEQAVLEGLPERALLLLAEHTWRFPQGQLTEAREVSRITALCNTGDLALARRERARFITRRPDSPYLDRVRDLCR